MSLQDNLIAYWPCDESSGNLLDVRGSNTLTETGGTIAAVAGKVGGARDFESTQSRYFTLADNAALSTGDIDFTFGLWVKLESKGAQRGILGKWGGANPEYILIYNAANDRFQWFVSAAGGNGNIAADVLGSPAVDTWYFIVVWHDAANNQIGIQINNGTANTASHTHGVLDGLKAFEIGRNPDAGGQYHDGLLDEIGFWKRMLSPAERTQLYNGGNGINYATLLFEEAFRVRRHSRNVLLRM